MELKWYFIFAICGFILMGIDSWHKDELAVQKEIAAMQCKK